jgi:hypothetical protein
MATIEQAIYNILVNTAGITALVGTRIYQVKMPDNVTFPAISYQTSFGSQIESFTGYSGLRNPVINIDTWASSAGAAKDLAEKVRAALHGYSGTYGDITIDNVLEWSFIDMYDSDTEIFHVSSNARFWYY